MPNRSLSLVARVEQSAAAQVAKKKGPSRCMTLPVQAEIVYRWIHGGQITRQISDGLRIHNREAVERVIQGAINGRGPLTPAGGRRAA